MSFEGHIEDVGQQGMKDRVGAFVSERTEESRILEAYARRQGLVSRERYSLFNIGNLLQAQAIDRCFLRLLRRYGRTSLESQKILEIGCGSGYWLRKFIEWGARPEKLFGVELLEDRIAQARNLLPPATTLECANAANLRFPSETFDIVSQFTVFTSILDSGVRARIAREMRRVLKKDGIILWYDFHVNNPWNPDVKRVTRRDIAELFAGSRLDLCRITLAPPLARTLGGMPSLLYWMASGVKIFCTHYAGVFQK